MDEEKFWNIRSTKKGFEGKWIHINLDQVELPDGSMIEFEAIEFQRHGTGIVAENSEGEIILVKNFRYINNYESWEIPAGTIPPGCDPAEIVLEELKLTGMILFILEIIILLLVQAARYFIVIMQRM